MVFQLWSFCPPGRRVPLSDLYAAGESSRSFELLRHLVTHAGKVLTHRQLLRGVWGPAQADEVQYLRVFIRGLRQKLEPDPTRPTHILTELSVGYRLQLPPMLRADRPLRPAAASRRFDRILPAGAGRAV